MEDHAKARARFGETSPEIGFWKLDQGVADEESGAVTLRPGENLFDAFLAHSTFDSAVPSSRPLLVRRPGRRGAGACGMRGQGVFVGGGRTRFCAMHPPRPRAGSPRRPDRRSRGNRAEAPGQRGCAAASAGLHAAAAASSPAADPARHPDPTRPALRAPRHRREVRLRRGPRAGKRVGRRRERGGPKRVDFLPTGATRGFCTR